MISLFFWRKNQIFSLHRQSPIFVVIAPNAKNLISVLFVAFVVLVVNLDYFATWKHENAKRKLSFLGVLLIVFTQYLGTRLHDLPSRIQISACVSHARFSIWWKNVRALLDERRRFLIHNISFLFLNNRKHIIRHLTR